MSLSQAVKKNISSIQVLKTLSVLLEDNYTMLQLVEKLNANEEEPIFNNSVVSKYINTCRYCGIEIPKIQNKYFVTRLPFGLDLSGSDIEVLEKVQKLCKQTFSNRFNKYFDAFVQKVGRYSNKQIIRVEKNMIDIITEKFENAIQENKKVRLMLKNRDVMDCIPLGTTTHQKKLYFNVKYQSKERFIAANRVTGFEVLNQVFHVPNYEANEAIFVVKDALSRRYNLRENEELVNKYETHSIISNKGEDRDILLSRLLRYDSLCEIKSPIDYREQMKKIIDDTLANYGE